MANRPKSVIAASALAVIGGIVAIAAMAHDYKESTDMLVTIGLYLLITVLFFASAGFLYSNGKGNYISLVFLELMNVIVIAAMIIGNADSRVYGFVLLALAVLSTIASLFSVVPKWIEFDRV